LGKLLKLSGVVTTEPPFQVAHVTVATDVGRQSVTTNSNFQFLGLTPGPFEIYGDAPADDNPEVPLQGAYLSSSLRADLSMPLPLSSKSNGGFEIRGIPPRAQPDSRLEVRRKDLAGEGEIVRMKSFDAQLPPGRWEVR